MWGSFQANKILIKSKISMKLVFQQKLWLTAQEKLQGEFHLFQIKYKVIALKMNKSLKGDLIQQILMQIVKRDQSLYKLMKKK